MPIVSVNTCFKPILETFGHHFFFNILSAPFSLLS